MSHGVSKLAKATLLCMSLSLCFSSALAEEETEEAGTTIATTDEDSGFACLVTEESEVFWETGTDSCSDLAKKCLPEETYVSVHVVPMSEEEYPYLYPEDGWEMLIYGESVPEWFDEEKQSAVWEAFDEWYDEVYGCFDYEGLRSLTPEDTLSKSPEEGYVVTDEDIEALKEFAYTIYSLPTYLRTCVTDTLYAKVGTSVGAEAYNYVTDICTSEEMQKDSTLSDLAIELNVSFQGVTQMSYYAALAGSFFDLDEWLYYTGDAEGYPYSVANYLWDNGLLITRDNDEIWRLHDMKTTSVLYELDGTTVSTNQAFAAVMDEDGEVYWKVGLDNVTALESEFDLDGDLLEIRIQPMLEKEDAEYELIDGYNRDATIIFPYLDPNSEWTIQILNEEIPDWYSEDCDEALMAALDEWKEAVYSGLDFESAKTIFEEDETIEPAEYTDDDIALLAEWVRAWHNITDKGITVNVAINQSGYTQASANVWSNLDSWLTSRWRYVHTECPGFCVADGYFAYKGDEGDNALDSVVGDAVDDVMVATVGYFFTNVDEWLYYDGDEEGYPFEAGAQLVMKNLVPYTDGTNWYFASGEEAEVVFEIDEDTLLELY